MTLSGYLVGWPWRTLRLPVVTTNDVHYAQREGQRLHDTLVAIRHNLTVEKRRAHTCAPTASII